MEKVRFGIIGVGNIGTTHAKNLLSGKITNGRLTAVCDTNEERISSFLSLDGAAGTATFTDYRQMLSSGKIDAVIISVPHYFHPGIAIDAMRAHIHVVCEKPAGVYTKQVKEMNAEAEKSDVLFTMMFNQRTNCVYRKMREMIQNGALGEIKRINWIITSWYRSQFYYDSGDWRATWRGEGGGVLLNQCPHQLDLLQWIPDMMPCRVHSFCRFGKWHDIEVEDDVTAYFEYENGASGVFVTGTADAPGTNRLEILGNYGKLVCEDNKLVFHKLTVGEREFNATCRVGFGHPEADVSEVETDGKNPQHAGILNNFADAILGIEPLFVDGREGLKGVTLMNAMLLSTWLDKTIELPFDDGLYLAELNKRIACGRIKKTGSVVLDTEGTYGSEDKK